MLTNTATGNLQFTNFSKPPRNTFFITQPETDYTAAFLPSCVPRVLGTFLHSPFPSLWPGSQRFVPLPCPQLWNLQEWQVAIGGGGGSDLLCQKVREEKNLARKCYSSFLSFSPSLRASASATLAELPWSSLCPASREVLVLWAQTDSTI